MCPRNRVNSMDKQRKRHTAAWLLATALLAAGAPALAATGSPEELAKVQAQLQEAMTALDAASAALANSEAKLAAARANLDKADAGRIAADEQLTRTEAQAAGGRVTRRQVDADRALVSSAADAVSAVRIEIDQAQGDIAASQSRLLAAKAVVDTAAASAAAYLGDAPPN